MLAQETLPKEARETFWRSLQTFCITRVAIAFVVLAYFIVNVLWQNSFEKLATEWRYCITYVVVAVGFALLSVYSKKRFMLQLLVQLAIDLIVISFLYAEAGGVRSGIAILYLFPLAGCAILLPLVSALFFDALVALFMLGESAYQLLHSQSDASLPSAGLYGGAFFAASYVINRLAAKLIKQEELAARRGRDLHMQESINRLVIADMGDGILVIGPSTEVLAANPAAERMLGLHLPVDRITLRLSDLPLLAPIADAYIKWAAAPSVSTAISHVMLKTHDAHATHDGKATRDDAAEDARGTANADAQGDEYRLVIAHLKLRFVPVDADQNAGFADLRERRTVIFVQDISEIENRAQQLKLASMGRLTASIAHEVRNPLSAIGHAASLMKEDAIDKTHARLLDIVGDNVVRLNRMIEDILKLSRKAHSNAEPLHLAPFLTELLDEFRDTHHVPAGRIALRVSPGNAVRFDPLHLREVVVNLVSNALRYASGQEGAISIQTLSPAPGRLELHVRDDGPPISPEVRAHLFEPFYTTSSKGTGLGLYVARELCLNNGAMLDYEYRTEYSAGHGRAARAAASAMPGDAVFAQAGQAGQAVASPAGTIAHAKAAGRSGRFVITFSLQDHS
jgi:two-component system, NtrC family, sensor histidine kinase PilS